MLVKPRQFYKTVQFEFCSFQLPETTYNLLSFAQQSDLETLPSRKNTQRTRSESRIAMSSLIFSTLASKRGQTRTGTKCSERRELDFHMVQSTSWQRFSQTLRSCTTECLGKTCFTTPLDRSVRWGQRLGFPQSRTSPDPHRRHWGNTTQRSLTC